jgi:FkbM family methyltransferase
MKIFMADMRMINKFKIDIVNNIYKKIADKSRQIRKNRYIKELFIELQQKSSLKYPVHFNLPFLDEAWKLRKLMDVPGGTFSSTADGILYTLEGKSLLLTDWNDIFIAVDTFVDFDYGFGIPGGKEIIVYDVGANIGDTSIIFASMQHVKKVYSFEPLPGIFKRMEKNLYYNPEISHKVECFNLGLGKNNASIPVLYPSGCAYCATHTEQWHSDIGNLTTEIMDIHDAVPILRELINKSPHDVTNVLKSDCEGAEFDLIPYLGENKILRHFSIILMEFHRTNPDPIIYTLEKCGFTVFWSASKVGITGRLYATKGK